MCFQSACIRGCKVTSVAFVCLFPIVRFQMSPKMACLRGCIVTLVALVWRFSLVSLFLQEFLALQTKVIILTSLFHCDVFCPNVPSNSKSPQLTLALENIGFGSPLDKASLWRWWSFSISWSSDLMSKKKKQIYVQGSENMTRINIKDPRARYQHLGFLKKVQNVFDLHSWLTFFWEPSLVKTPLNGQKQTFVGWRKKIELISYHSDVFRFNKNREPWELSCHCKFGDKY